MAIVAGAGGGGDDSGGGEQEQESSCSEAQSFFAGHHHSVHFIEHQSFVFDKSRKDTSMRLTPFLASVELQQTAGGTGTLKPAGSNRSPHSAHPKPQASELSMLSLLAHSPGSASRHGAPCAIPYRWRLGVQELLCGVCGWDPGP